MSLHTADVSARLFRFLDRKQQPRHLAEKEQAIHDEGMALVACAERFAPRGADALAAWWPKLETELGLSSRGFWPTEKELADAARAVNVAEAKLRPSSPQQQFVVDEVDLAARRIGEGKPVPEGWLWGSVAVALLRSGRVDEATLARYRSAAFHERVKVYGKDAALGWEAGVKALHADSEHSDPSIRRTVVLPNIRHVADSGDGGFSGAPVIDDRSRHWSEGADPNGPEMAQLRAARAANPIVQAALRSRPLPEPDPVEEPAEVPTDDPDDFWRAAGAGGAV